MDNAEFLDSMRCIGFIAGILFVMWLSHKVFGGGE